MLTIFVWLNSRTDLVIFILRFLAEFRSWRTCMRYPIFYVDSSDIGTLLKRLFRSTEVFPVSNTAKLCMLQHSVEMTILCVFAFADMVYTSVPLVC